MRIHPVEKLRRIWTPNRELDEMVETLDPQTEVDSMIRHFLHSIVEQHGPQTVDLERLNTGTLRWEVVHHEPTPGQRGGRQATLWVEDAIPAGAIAANGVRSAA